jgi:hypothetical protein
MKILIFLLFPNLAFAVNLMVCNGDFALCAASGATLTGKTIRVDGKEFSEAMAVCPVLKGRSLADSDLMKGSCKAPPGKVWSLFSADTTYPQAPDWTPVTAKPRQYTMTKDMGMSNMWSFICDKQPKKVNGVTLANCYGPVNESPWNAAHLVPGTNIITQAPIEVLYPVGGNLP